MPKYDDAVIIISDDEQDQITTTQQVLIRNHNKSTRQQDGTNKTNPILLDDDEMDWTPKTETIVNLIPCQTSTQPPLPTQVQRKKRPQKKPKRSIVIPTTPPDQHDFVYDSTISTNDDNIMDFSLDILDYLGKCNEPEMDSALETPDWSIIADLDTTNDSVTIAWQPPSTQTLPTDTVVPEGMDLLELFTRLDFYQHSLIQHVKELQPKTTLKPSNQHSPPTISPTASTRTLLKRTTTAHSPSTKHSLSPSSYTTPIHSTTLDNSTDLAVSQTNLIKRLEIPYLTTMPRPYIPNLVWQGSNWEDWAQFIPGDLIHVPFTGAEDALIEKVVRKTLDRKRRTTASSIYGDNELWDELAVLLPGREAQDCKFRYMDLEKPAMNIFNKAQIVIKEKVHAKNWNNYYNLLSTRCIGGITSLPMFKSTLWTNLKSRKSVGEGSGDASCLLIERDPKNMNSFQMVAGSLCDDNQSYNMEGNLRLWHSSSGKIHHLKGHSINVTSGHGETQELWRTVHDVKASNNKKLLFSASRDSNAKVWNMESNKLLSTLAFHNGPVHQIAVMEQEEHVIATGSADGSGVIWIIGDRGRSGKGTICETEMVDDMDNCSVECLEFGHGASDKKLFMGYRTNLPDQYGWITAFDVESANPIYNIKDIRGSVGCLAISHSGKYILSGNDGAESGDQMLHLNDVMTGKSILLAKTGHLDVNCVCFSKCDNFIVSGSVANQVSVFDIRKASIPVYEFGHNDNSNQGRFIAPDAGIGIAGMHWMNSNRILITGGGDCTVKLWDVLGGGGLLKSYQVSDPINCLTVNEELNVLAAGVSGAQGVVHIWQP
ncbi:WD40-repeat-containing domain protein [Chlamydoabsidia padenii]|nr:WD40-repeat-containing domain protein [Chlamydoabsidia padenii]